MVKSCVVYIFRVDQQRRSCKGAESLYQVFKVVLVIWCEDLIMKEKVVKLRSISVKCLKVLAEI